VAAKPKARRKRVASAPLPLRYRLPNPPPAFVGREHEVETLVAAIKRAPVALVWGLGGLGKTALVLHSLHRYFTRRVPRTLIINLAPGDKAEDICISTIRALAEVEGHAEINWPSLMADPDSLAATAIDLAEMGNWWLVLDNLHHADATGVADVLGQLARYARKSRWIGISRVEPPMPELAGQILPLAGMRPEDLRSLAEQAQPRAEPDLLEQAVSASGGSPWQLQQLLAGKQVATESLGTDLLAGLPDTAVEFLQALCVLDRPFESDVLATVAPAPSEEQLRALERQALLERTDAGWRLHDVARPLVAATVEPKARALLERRCADALAEQSEPVALLEAVRLLCEDIDRTASVLDRHGEQLLANGRAPELWRLLERAQDERLSSWRLRIAVELGEARSLAQVQPPDQPSIEDQWMWARALYGQGRFEQAAEAARTVRGAANQDRERAFECGLLESRALRSLGHSGQALTVLDKLEAEQPGEIARREVVAAVYHVDLGEHRAGLDAIARARPHFDSLDGRARLEVGYGRVVAHYRLGELAKASEVLEEMVASVGERALFLEHGRMLLLLRAGIAADEGRLDEARAVYQRLEPLAAASSGLRPYVRGAHAACRFAMGDLAGLDDDIESLEGEIRELPSDHDIACSVATLRTRLRAARGEAAATVTPELWASDRSFFQKLQGLVTLEHNLRAGTYESDDWPAVEAFADNAELQVWAELCAALAAAAKGSFDDASHHVGAAVETARQAGYGALEAEATNVRCEVLTAAGRLDEVARLVENLTAMAERLPSARLMQAARFFGAVTAADGLDAARLEQIAAADETAPASARRARALLGGTPPLDALETELLTNLRAREPAVTIELLSDSQERPGWTAGWGMDEPATAVWLPDGRRVQFSTDALPWRILATIADHEGSVSKEDLVLAAWDEQEYHPLRHDNRLRLAVRKLRQVLEDDASNPTRVLTTSDGYAFGGHVRLLRRL